MNQNTTIGRLIKQLSKMDHKTKLLVDLQLTIKEKVKPTKNKVSKSNIWADSTGLIWYPAIEGTYNFDQANLKAKELGLRLPTIEEFRQAEKEGIRKKFSDFQDKYFWSSSVSSDYRDFAWFFYGSVGYTYDYYRSYVVSVRCVGR